jgi:hypothetical protein
MGLWPSLRRPPRGAKSPRKSSTDAQDRLPVGRNDTVPFSFYGSPCPWHAESRPSETLRLLT